MFKMDQQLDIQEVINELTTRFGMKVAKLEQEVAILNVAKRQLEKQLSEQEKPQ
ncbi:hypothetical protein ACFVRU_23330 [Streptomyces sp. NPDC057927]